MNLKPIEQVKYDAITTLAKALKDAGMDLAAVKQYAQKQIDDFEESTRYVVKLHPEPLENGSYVSLIDTKKDFIRARQSGETGQALRCKVFNVPIDIKVQKNDEFEFSNAQVADALEELRNIVLRLDVEVSTAGNVDFNSDGKPKQEQTPEADDIQVEEVLSDEEKDPAGTTDAGKDSHTDSEEESQSA